MSRGVWIRSSLVTACLFLMTGGNNAVAENEKWTTKKELPTARGGCAGEVVNGKFYVIGGGFSAYAHLDTVEAYDPAQNAWRTLAPMPTHRNNVVSAKLGTLVYVIGGLVTPPGKVPDDKAASLPTALVEAYDTARDCWIPKASMPFGRVKPLVGVVDGKIYVLGGRRDDFNTTSIIEYDPVRDTWTEKGQMPIGVRHGAACVFNGKIYLTGGWSPPPDPKTKGGNFHADAFVYDPKAGVCTPIAAMSTSRAGHVIVATDTQLYVLGGVTTGKTFVTTVDVYDPASDAWKTVDQIPSPRAMFAVGVIHGKFYLAGGWTALYKKPNTIFEEYAPMPTGGKP